MNFFVEIVNYDYIVRFYVVNIDLKIRFYFSFELFSIIAENI